MWKCRSTSRCKEFSGKGTKIQIEHREMAKRHSTELDSKDSLIIGLKDHIRLLEGKPTSTGAETQLATGKESFPGVGILTRAIHANAG